MRGVQTICVYILSVYMENVKYMYNVGILENFDPIMYLIYIF